MLPVKVKRDSTVLKMIQFVVFFFQFEIYPIEMRAIPAEWPKPASFTTCRASGNSSTRRVSNAGIQRHICAAASFTHTSCNVSGLPSRRLQSKRPYMAENLRMPSIRRGSFSLSATIASISRVDRFFVLCGFVSSNWYWLANLEYEQFISLFNWKMKCE